MKQISPELRKRLNRLTNAFFLIMTVWIIQTACNKQGPSRHNRIDSVETSALIFFPYDNSFYTVDLTKFRRDTFAFKETDGNVAKKTWQTDSFYRVKMRQPLVDPVTKKIKLDSLKNPIYVEKLVFLGQEYIWVDYGKSSKALADAIKNPKQ